MSQSTNGPSTESAISFFKNLSPKVIRDKPLPGQTSASSEIIAISINLCGTRLVASRTDKSLRMWKLVDDRVVDPAIIEDAHSRAVESISWDPNAEFTFATVGRDEYIRVWQASTGKPENMIKTSSTNLKLVRYSADGELLVAIDRDSNVFVYAPNQNFKLMAEFKLSEHAYDLKWFHYEHEFFVIGLHDGSLPVYQVVTLPNGEVEIKTKTTLLGHRSSATSIAISPRGDYFAVGASEGIISLWDCSKMINSGVIADVDEVVASLDCNHDGSYVAASFDKDSNAIIYDKASGQKVFEIQNSVSGNMTFSSICWFPNKNALAYSSDFGLTFTVMLPISKIETKRAAPTKGPMRRN
ncbi:uncharacterized protein LODBEIA_P56690 [Lodderomyces beijingensis]|uniref:Anaphase-promoting complex subunit 4 WD40 domain-containing protein n=1 Tax=Lodderomyces beijingensis TaxID=1775926 RepID=A0ABP0ZWU6_9ASCO